MVSPRTSRYALRYGDQLIRLPQGRFTIGRSLTSDLIFEDAQISRHHATVHVDGERITITDLGGPSGIVLNDDLVGGVRELRVEDVLTIGVQRLKLIEVVTDVQRPTAPPQANGANRRKVLLVDDSRSVRERTEVLLANAGFEVFTTHLPFAATAILEKERPQLVLIDVGMPALQGDQLTVFLRKQSTPGNVKLVLYSSWEPGRLEELATACGADGYIPKSTEPSEFVRMCSAWVTETPLE